MQRQDVTKILSILKTAYPRFYSNMSKEDANETIALWTDMFEEEDVEAVTIAVKNLINYFQFPPTIADVKNELYKLYEGEQKSDIELWNELKQALRSSIYGADEIFPRLSPEIQKYVKNPMQLKELAMMNAEDIDTVQKGIFLKQIPIIRQREKENFMMLPSMKKFIGELADKLDANKLLNKGDDTND